MTRTLVLPTLNGQTLTFVRTGDTVTVRVAKDGHNRGIGKVTVADGKAISGFLA